MCSSRTQLHVTSLEKPRSDCLTTFKTLPVPTSGYQTQLIAWTGLDHGLLCVGRSWKRHQLYCLQHQRQDNCQVKLVSWKTLWRLHATGSGPTWRLWWKLFFSELYLANDHLRDILWILIIHWSIFDQDITFFLAKCQIYFKHLVYIYILKNNLH